jgi:hypothetical protein
MAEDETPQVGKVYRVEIEDCCVALHFTARLTQMDEEQSVYTFDNGVVITEWLFPGWAVPSAEVAAGSEN